ncbi:hypothetical protein MAR_027803, partial [Mya arenaria]
EDQHVKESNWFRESDKYGSHYVARFPHYQQAGAALSTLIVDIKLGCSMDTPNQSGRQHRVSAVRRDLIEANEQLDSVNRRVDLMQQGLSPVPDKIDYVEHEMDAKAQKLAEIEERNKIHSAKLKLLQNEIKYEKMRGDMLMDHYKLRGDNTGVYDQSPRDDYFLDSYRDGQNTDRGNYLTQTGPPPPSPRKSQTNTPYLPENTDQQRNGNRSGQVSPRKTQYDERPLEADPRHRQNPDVHQTDQRKPNFDYEDMMRERQKHVYGYHDSTAINPHLWENKPKHRKYPWYDHETYTQPGGFLFIRFDDSGYDIMNNALKIFVYEMSQPNKQQNWNLSRRQTHPDAKMTENAVATFWFNRKEGAEGFFENGHRNQLREPCFPTPNGYEAFYVPLLSPPPMR